MARSNYIPKYQFQAIVANRKSAPQVVMIQRKLKSGKWGKACETKRLGKYESDQDVVDRLNEFNPGSEFRLAE
jgi:hypothetical protein